MLMEQRRSSRGRARGFVFLASLQVALEPVFMSLRGYLDAGAAAAPLAEFI
jgi:hypothetical protein